MKQETQEDQERELNRQFKIDRSLIDPTAWLRRAFMRGTTIFCERRELEWFTACESRAAYGEYGPWTIASDNVLKSSLTANMSHLTLVCGPVWILELILGQVRMFVYENMMCNLYELWKGVEARIEKQLRIEEKKVGCDPKSRGSYVVVIDRFSPELLVIGIEKGFGAVPYTLRRMFLNSFAAGTGEQKIRLELSKWRKLLLPASKMVESMWNLMALAAGRDRHSGGYCNILSGSKHAKWRCRLSRKLTSIGDTGAKMVKQPNHSWASGRRFLLNCQLADGISTYETGVSSSSMPSVTAAAEASYSMPSNTAATETAEASYSMPSNTAATGTHSSMPSYTAADSSSEDDWSLY